MIKNKEFCKIIPKVKGALVADRVCYSNNPC